MGMEINCPKQQSEEPRKRLKKLRSIKRANLDKFRLSMKRTKSRLSQEMLLPDDSMEMTSKQKQTSAGKLQEAPTYMKATICFSARREPLQHSQGDASMGKKSAKGIKRMYSSKRLRIVSGLKSELSSDRQGTRNSTNISSLHVNEFHGNALASRGSDLEDLEDSPQEGVYQDQKSIISGATAKLRLVRSGSIKLTRVRSRKLSRRRWSKSRLDQASIFMTDDEDAKELPSEATMSELQTNDMDSTSSYNTTQKTKNSSFSGPGLKPIRTLWKMPSIRSRRRPVKKQSKLAGLDGTRLDRPTCSSALKSCKAPKVDDDSGVCESKHHLIGNVCPYTYCSLHGHPHDALPTLKSFISTNRRLLKKQKSIRLKRKSKSEAKCYGNISKTNRSKQVVPVEERADILMLETETEKSSVAEGNGAEARDSDRTITGESMTEPRKAHSETAKFYELDHQRSAGDFEFNSISAQKNTVFENHKYANMWNLIYKHLSATGNEVTNEEGDKGKDDDGSTVDTESSDCDQNQHHPDENQDMNLDTQVAVGEKLQFNQAEAIEFVQEAVDEILHLDEQLPLYQPINRNMIPSHFEVCRNAGEPADPANEDFQAHKLVDRYPRESKNIQHANSSATGTEKEDSKEGKQPKKQRSKGFEKLRKMIITAKFIKAVEKLRKIKPHKPQYLSSETKSRVERAQLRHLSMDERKNTEEWMLDFALRQVIAKLAPAQQRRVGMLIEAFEKVKPETNIKCEPAKMPPSNYTASPTKLKKEERSIALDLDNSGLNDDIVQDPAKSATLDAFVASANGEDCLHNAILASAPIVPEMDDNRRRPEVIENPMGNKREDGDYHRIQQGAIENPKQDKDQLVTEVNHQQEYDKETSHIIAKPVKGGFSNSKEEKEKQAKEPDTKHINFNPSDEVLKQSIMQMVDEATASRSIFKCHSHECCESHDMVSRSNKQLLYNSRIIRDSYEKATDAEVLAKPRKAKQEISSSIEALLQHPTSDSKANSPLEESNILFDKEKFSNVWHMVYKCFIANEAIVSGNMKVEAVDGKEQDEDVKASNEIKGSDSSLGHLDKTHTADMADSAGTKKNELNQAYAIQLVQEAMDELLLLHEQLSDQQPSIPYKVPEQNKTYSNEGQTCASEPADSAKENINRDRLGEDHSLELKDTHVTEPEKTDANEQKPLQRQTSKTSSKLKKLVLSTKFIKAMEKLRKISTCKRDNFSSQAGSEAEKVCLRHSSPDERRNSEEWMLDYALQQVIDKLAPAQQRRVAMLTQAFETLTPELQQMSTKFCDVKMQADNYIASATKQKSDEDEFVVTDHDSPKIHKDNAHESDDPFHKDASAILANIIQQEEYVDKVQDKDFEVEIHNENFECNDVKLHIHNLPDMEGHPLCSPHNIKTKNKEDAEFKSKHHAQHERSLIDYQGDQQNVNVAKDALAGRKYSKMWQLIYQHVKSSCIAESENQTAETISKEDQITGATFETAIITDGQGTNAPHEKLELTQSDAIKLMQEALDGILQQCNASMEQKPLDENDDRTLNIKDPKGSPDYRVKEEDKNDALLQPTYDAITGSDEKNGEGNKSEQKALQRYSKLKRAVICSKFVKAMEKMQKLHTQKKRCHHHPVTPDQEAQRVHLRHCLIDERNKSEVWMLDYALQQVIAKLAPMQLKKVAMLVDAFETVGPETEEAKKEPWCNKSDPSDRVCTARNEDCNEETSVESCQNQEPVGSSDFCKKEPENISNKVLDDRVLPESDEVTVPQPHNEDGDTLRAGHSASEAEVIITPSLNGLAELKSFLPKETKITRSGAIVDTHPTNPFEGESSQSHDFGKATNSAVRNNIFLDRRKNSSMWHLIYQHIKSGIPDTEAKQIPSEIDTYGQANGAEKLKEETSSDSDPNSSDRNENADKEIQNSDSTSSELQETDAIELVQEAVNEILEMQEQGCDDQPIEAEEKAEKEDRSSQEISRSYNVLSKVILCKKFIRAMEKMKKSYPKDQQPLPQEPDFSAESIHLRPQTMDGNNCEEWMLDYALQQVIGKLAPTQKKKVSMLVEAFERVSPLPDAGGYRKLNAAA